MGYQVILSPLSRKDLRGISRFIALDNPARATTFSQFLITSTKRLSDFPEMGRTVPEFRDRALREIVVRSYLVIYRVDHSKRRVEVVRFWHGARGIPKLV